MTLHCSYCTTRCTAAEPDECYAVEYDENGDEIEDEPSETELERIADNVGVPLWERV